MNQTGMRGAVRELYKRLLYAGRSYPQGINHVRDKVKAGKPWELDLLALISSGTTTIRVFYCKWVILKDSSASNSNNSDEGVILS